MIFEVFKTGKHISSNGVEKDFTESDLDQIVSSYNPSVHEAPICIGHPKDNSPAHGWIKKIYREGQILFAEAADLSKNLIDALKNKLFKKRSVALYPDLKLRHVGFVPVPAVKGLADIPDAELINLSDDENDLQNFEMDFSDEQFNEEKTADDPDKINKQDFNEAHTCPDKSKTVGESIKHDSPQFDFAALESKIDSLLQFAEKFHVEDFLKSNEQKTAKLSLELDIAYFENQLAYKVENRSLLPAVKEKIISIIQVLCGYKFDEPDSNFSKSLYEKFDSLLEDFSTQNLFTEFAEKPDNNDSLSPEVFQYAEVDPQSRQIHNKAINLMKSDKLTYLSAVQKVLLNN